MGTDGEHAGGAAIGESGTHGRSLAAEVSVWVVSIVVAAGLIFWLLDGLRVGSAWPFSHSTLTGDDMYDLARSTVALTGLLGATVAVSIAIRRQRSTEETVRINAESQRVAAEAQRTAAEAQLVAANAYELDLARNQQEQVRDLRDRFTEAARQLGDLSAAIRLAGAYAMAALADDWIQRGEQAEGQSCIDVLCAYVRTPRRIETEEGRDAEREVKQTVIRVITSRLQDNSDKRDWRGADLDFTGAIFDGSFDFSGAIFTAGNVSFARCVFPPGCSVTFKEATFASPTISFADATFDECDVRFVKVRFESGFVEFTNALLSEGRLHFHRTQVTGATVSFNRFRMAGHLTFTQTAMLGGRLSFNHALLGDGLLRFNGLSMSGGTMLIQRTVLEGGSILFSNAAFTGGSLRISEPEVSSGTVQFERSLFEGTFVTGPWDPEKPPPVWPPPTAAL